MKVKVEILHCSAHGFYGISVNGLRITPGKCCGSWVVVRSWTMKANELRGEVQRAITGCSQ